MRGATEIKLALFFFIFLIVAGTAWYTVSTAYQEVGDQVNETNEGLLSTENKNTINSIFSNVLAAFFLLIIFGGIGIVLWYIITPHQKEHDEYYREYERYGPW